MTTGEGHESETLLNALLDNELDAPSAERVSGHLDTCEACRARYDSLRETAGLLREEAAYFELPPDLVDRVFPPPATAAAPPPNAAREGRILPLIRRTIAPAFSAAALAAALTLYIATPGSSPSLGDEAVSAHIRSLMGNHLIDVASSDHHTVKPWFAGKLDFSPPVADFASRGFALVGGRVDYLQHRDTAVLIYRHDKHIITVFVYPEDTGGDEIAAREERGYNVVSWTRNALRVVAVSDMEMTELRKLAALFRAQ